MKKQLLLLAIMTVVALFTASEAAGQSGAIQPCSSGGAATMPFHEGFEYYDSVEYIPYCWTQWEAASGYPFVDGYGGRTGNSALSFYPSMGDQSIVSPAVPVPSSGLEVQFWLQGGDALQVGYVTTSDLATAEFHQVAVVGPSADTMVGFASEYFWSRFTVLIDNIGNHDSIYVVLRMPASLGFGTVLVDDVTIRAINSCPQADWLSVSMVGASEAVLTWQCAGGGQWQVAYGPAGFDPDTVATYSQTNDMDLTVTGLANGTRYDFYVRTVCGTQYGYWSDPVSVMPNVYAVTANRDTITSCNIVIVDDGGIDGDFSLGLNQLIVLQPDSEGQSVRIQGFAHLYNPFGTLAADRNLLRVFAGTDTNGMLLASYNTVDVDNIDLVSEVGAMTLWFHTGQFNEDYNDGFQLHVTCEDAPTCLTPYGLTVSNVTGISATVAWEYDNTVYGEAPGFTLTVVDDGDNEFGTFGLDGNLRSYIIIGLEERTAYRVLLHVDCDEIDTLEATFVTPCNNGGEVPVGTGTATTSYMPAYLFASSSFSQQLFTPSDLVDIPVIHGFKVYMTNSAATPDRQWDVYFDTTSRTSFSSSNDFVPPSAGNRYFSGMVSFSQGWVEVTLDSSFAVPAGMSVLMTVCDRTGSAGSSRSFRTTTTSTAMSIYGYNYTGMLDVTSPSGISSATVSTLNRRNTLRFITTCDPNACIAPIIVDAVPTANGVTLTWIPVGGATEWKIEYRIGAGAWVVDTIGVTDTTYTVTGLAPITTYGFRVGSLCGDAESSNTISATTLCGEYTLPFSQTFEVFSASEYNDLTSTCWARGSAFTGAYYHYPYRQSGYGCQSNHSLFMGGYRSYLVLPKMSVSVDSLSVGFYASLQSPDYYTATAEVGVCTDQTDTSTFVVVASRPVTDTAWQLVEVDLEGYSGPDGYIFVRMRQDGYAPMYIDNLTVTGLPDCRRVDNIGVTDVSTTSATITIVDHHNYGNYILYYGTDNDTAAADTLHVSGYTATLTGLVPNTQYYVWVAAQCLENAVGRTFAMPYFNTLCNPIAVTAEEPYLEEFEHGRLECISQESPDALRWVVATGNATAHAHSGSYVATVTSETTGAAMLLLPLFDFSALTDNAEMTFFRNAAGPAGRLEVYYRVGATAGWTLLGMTNSGTEGWERCAYTLPMSQGAALYQVALKVVSTTAGGIYVDDIRVAAPPECHMPANVTVRNVKGRSATVAWTGMALAYRVQYRTAGTLSWTSREVRYADTLNISPLDMVTRYEVKVTALCSPYSQSEASSPVVFTTDFCENRQESDNYSPAAVPAATTLSPVNSSRNYSYSEILIDSATLAGMSEVNGMAFYIDSVGSAPFLTNCQIYMGHTTAATMVSFHYDTTFVQVYDGDIGTNATGMRRVRFSTPFVWDGHRNAVLGVMYITPDHSTHGDTRFAAHQSSTNKVYHGGTPYTAFTPAQANTLSAAYRGASNVVPDITFYACLPTCHEPVISAVTTTPTSITVDWYNEDAVVVMQIKEAGAAAWGSHEVVNAGHHDIHSYTYDQLSPVTTYNIRLRRDCTAESMDYSGWVELTVTTDTTCPVPADVTVGNIGPTSATIAWTDDGAATGSRWEIHLWNADEDRYYDVTTNPATVDGLTAGSTYHVAVRAYCCQYDRVVGEYSNTVTFDNICQPASGLTAQRNGGDVTLTWRAGSHHADWVYLYGYDGFEPNQQLGFGIVHDTTVTISDLEGGYVYAFRVRARCGADWNADWSNDIRVDMLGIYGLAAGDARLSLSPNPASGRVSLRIGNGNGLASVTILGVDGREIQTLTHASPLPLTLDVSRMAAGTYFVRVQTDTWVAVRKLVVQ